MPAPGPGGPGQAFGAPPPGAPGPAAAAPGYPFNASPSPGPAGFTPGGPSGQVAPAAPGYPFTPQSTGLADAPPIADAPRFQRGPFDAGPAPYFEDVGGHEPERLLVRSGPSPAILAIGGTLLAGVAAAAFVFGGDLLNQLEPPEVDPVEDTAEEVESSVEPEPAPSPEPTEASEPAAESAAASEEPPAETAAAAPDEAGDSGESGEATNDSAEASADPTPAAPTTKKRDSGSGSSGTTSKKKKTTTKKATPKVKKKRKKTKREKRADQAAERDPGRVIYELQMLSAAKKALNSKPLQALAYAEQHASEFPRSQFVAQRREIMIKALCKLGRKDKAQREASKSAKAQRVFDSHCR